MDEKKQDKPRDAASERHYEENATTPADINRAHTQADKDMASDPDLSAHSPNDDLDEGESARLGENTGLV